MSGLLVTFANDFRFAWRQLLMNPGFTAVAILTLALGIGANTAIFSVVHALLFRPLAFVEPDRLVWIANTGTGGLSGSTTRVANFQEWRKLNTSFADLAAYDAFFDYASSTMTGAGEPERLRAVGVSQNFLTTLGVQPLLGRNFDEQESQWNGRKAVLLTYGFWQRRFGGDSNIVGRSITLNKQATSVVGVLPASFDFASVFAPGSKAELLAPFPMSPETDRWGNTLGVIGRLKPGTTLAAARAEFDLLNQQLKRAFPERQTEFGAALSPLREQISGRFRRSFLILFGAVGCVLLIACSNLSNLLLVRAAGRSKEFAVRVALGARRSRLVRQLLTESILLACCGAGLGLPLAFASTRVLAALHAFKIPLLQTVAVDQTALIFTLVVTGVTGALFGMAPALRLSTSDLHVNLNEATRGSTEGRGRTWFRDSLVVGEIALAFVLLVAAGLFIRSFERLLDVDLGFQPEHAVAWRIDRSQPFASAAESNPFYGPVGGEAAPYYEGLVRNIESIPGVESAGLTDTLPLGRNRSWGVRAKGRTYLPGQVPVAFPRIVNPGYTRTMGIPLRAGRELSPRDTAQTESVLLINETMARMLWPGQEAVGQTVLLYTNEWRVVGIVGNVRHSALDQEAGPEMYLPMAQVGTDVAELAMELVVRTRLAVGPLSTSVQAALRQVDPNLATSDFQTLRQIVDQAVAPKRLITVLLGGFSILALILAALGAYGLIAYSVSQRTQEIGIRMALGAPNRSILRLIIGEGMKRALLGVIIGVAASLVLTRLVQSLLFGVSATDLLTFSGVALLLTSVAFLASWLPARRAARIEPMEALRHE